MLSLQVWRRREGRSDGLPGTQAAATYRALLFLAAGDARGRAGFFLVVALGRVLIIIGVAEKHTSPASLSHSLPAAATSATRCRYS